MTQLERRRIEAEILAQVYETLKARMDLAQALAIIAETTERAARRAGADFAASAPDGPGLEHFATVVDIWRAGGALDIDNVRMEDGVWSFNVTRCAYADLYINDMGLAPELAYALSCGRDAAFAAGYFPGLRLERSPTIAQGSPSCLFRFAWDA